MYNTAFNTVGVGDPVPFGLNGCAFGSGDRFDNRFVSRGTAGNKSYKQYQPAKMTFKAPRPMSMPGFPRMPKRLQSPHSPRSNGMFPVPPRPRGILMPPPPPPPPRIVPVPVMVMPFGIATKRSASSTAGTLKGYSKQRPLIVKVSSNKTKKNKKK